MKDLFSPSEVAQLTGLSYRQIQYWDSSGFIRPSHRRMERFRGYTFADLILLEVAHQLRRRGSSVQRLRVLIRSLTRMIRQVPVSHLEALTFRLEGDQILVFTGEMLQSRASSCDTVEVEIRELAARVERLLPEDPSVPRKQVG